MSGHPEDNDLSFDELMAQYHQYEKEVETGGGSDGRSSQGLGTDLQNIMSEDFSGKHKAPKGQGNPRQDILASRHGKVTTRAPVLPSDVDRRTDAGRLLRPVSDDGRSTWGSVRWASDDGGSDAGSEARGGTGTGDLRRASSGTSLSMAELRAAQSEPMGDALMFGAPGFINLGKRGLLSLPMGAYTGAMLGPKVQLFPHPMPNSSPACIPLRIVLFHSRYPSVLSTSWCPQESGAFGARLGLRVTRSALGGERGGVGGGRAWAGRGRARAVGAPEPDPVAARGGAAAHRPDR